jgi:hypothetical protein
MHLLGGEERKALREIETHLMPEDAARPRAGSVPLPEAAVADESKKLEIFAQKDLFLVGLTTRISGTC